MSIFYCPFYKWSPGLDGLAARGKLLLLLVYGLLSMQLPGLDRLAARGNLKFIWSTLAVSLAKWIGWWVMSVSVLDQLLAFLQSLTGPLRCTECGKDIDVSRCWCTCWLCFLQG